MNRIRLATLLLPPAGLWLLWRHRESGLGRKLLGTVLILLYSFLHAAGVIWLLMLFAGLEIEWRGGFPPVLTFGKTKPDYAAIEAHRARQTNAAAAPAAPVAPVVPAATNAPVLKEGAADAYWTDFRGPRRDGQYTEGPILTRWPADGLRLRWRQPVGGGYASFVVAQGRAFTIEQRREQEVVTAYDMATGRELWAHSYPALFSESMGGDGPRATPTWHDGRIYSLGALGEFCCLDAASGRLLWRKQLLDQFGATGLYFGLSASPLIVDDKVLVLSGEPVAPMRGRTNHTLLAFDRVTGELRWGIGTEKASYVSPMLVTLAGERQVLVATATRFLGLRPADGAVLWEFPWRVQYDNTIAQPVLTGTNRFVVSGGYGAGCALVEIRREADGFRARQVWKNQNLKNKFNSSVFRDGFVYGLDEGILTCLDAETGQRRWKEGRYGYGQLLLAGGHLVVLGGDGELVLIEATPERHAEVARFPAIRGKTWNNPALAGGRLLVRNAAEMACFDIAP